MASEKQPSRAKLLQFPKEPGNARDELNLCEWPLAVLSDRTSKDCLELSFKDSLWDSSTSETIDRSLVISAPPKYGLPTAKDEEVLLALIHLSDQTNRFSDPTVPFTRYELIRLLGWNDGGKSYHRITESLARWKSVTLDYRNAWRDHKSNSWVSEIFSIIDNVTIYESDQGKSRNSADQINLPFSSFTWNRVFFESMQAKYFKRLDFGFYQSLRTPTAKRLFRFLDKRFGAGSPRWEFDLRDFACEHIGLSRNYDTGKIKEKLAPAICELEQHGYLTSLPREQRYTKRGKSWRILFLKGSERGLQPSGAKPNDSLVAALESRGITKKIAHNLASTFDKERINRQLEAFDWIMEEQPASLNNPAGFLAESIRTDFKPPAGFQTNEQREQSAIRRKQREKTTLENQQREEAERTQKQRLRAHIKAKRDSLSPDELEGIESEALSSATDEEQHALSIPAMREIQKQLLVDRLLLQRFPFAQKISASA